MTKGEQIYYCSLYTSTINCFVVMAIAFYGTISCDPPTEHRRDNVFLGNTGFNNDWCIDNPSNFDVLSMSYFAGYMTFELFSLVFLIGDLTSHTAKEDLMHHVLGLSTSVIAILGGRYVLNMYKMTSIIELSTIFNNLRIGLTKHNNKNGPLYFYNGLLLTLSFLCTRGFFYAWVLVGCLYPAILRDNWAENEPQTFKYIMWIFSIEWVLLYILNLFWLKKLLFGAYKILTCTNK
jgi:hypothetical protein